MPCVGLFSQVLHVDPDEHLSKFDKVIVVFIFHCKTGRGERGKGMFYVNILPSCMTDKNDDIKNKIKELLLQIVLHKPEEFCGLPLTIIGHNDCTEHVGSCEHISQD